MFVSNGEVFIDVLFESFGLVLPNHAAQVHTHDIEAELLCPAQFAVDSSRIKGGRLPHLNLVDGSARLEITSRTIRVLRVPSFRFFFRPWLVNVARLAS